MTKPKSSVVFIDLLGTKESHKVSNLAFEDHMSEFLITLIEYCIPLDESVFKIKHFSDCAFIFCNDNSSFDKLIVFLNNIRSSLLKKDLYFKAGVSVGDYAAYSDEKVKKIIFKRKSDKLIEKINRIVDFKLFGPNIVPAYLSHEMFKGVGFFVDKNLSKSFDSEWFVKSVFVNQSSPDKYFGFIDVRFNDSFSKAFYDVEYDSALKVRQIDSYLQLTTREYMNAPHVEWRDWYKGKLCENNEIPGLIIEERKKYRGKLSVKFKKQQTSLSIVFDQIIKAIRRSHIKNNSYPKYYLSLLVTIVRSSTFDYIWYDSKAKKWCGFPYVFYRLIINDLYFKFFKKFKHYHLVVAVMIDEIFRSIDTRRALALSRTTDDFFNNNEVHKLLPQYMFRSEEEIRKYWPKHLHNDEGDFKLMASLQMPNSDDFYLSLLQTAKITEKAIIVLFMKLGFKDIAKELAEIPDFVLSREYKSRIEHAYSSLEI